MLKEHALKSEKQLVPMWRLCNADASSPVPVYLSSHWGEVVAFPLHLSILEIVLLLQTWLVQCILSFPLKAAAALLLQKLVNNSNDAESIC